MPLSIVGVPQSDPGMEINVNNEQTVQDISMFMSFTHQNNFNEAVANQITNFSRQSFMPWPGDESPTCSKFVNHFALKGTFDPAAILASFPGSGNTWIRYLIEGATGFFTRGPDSVVSFGLSFQIPFEFTFGRPRVEP